MTGSTLIEARNLTRKGERDIDPGDIPSRLILAELALEKLGVHAAHKGKGLGTHWEDRIGDLDTHVIPEEEEEEEDSILGEFVTECGKVATLWSNGELVYRDFKRDIILKFLVKPEGSGK